MDISVSWELELYIIFLVGKIFLFTWNMVLYKVHWIIWELVDLILYDKLNIGRNTYFDRIGCLSGVNIRIEGRPISGKEV